ncbi:hypothetical protein E0Z10_g3148 [Xylaria hypoxylon]|uniref:Uncharacterized protein n=1 Tax=Xylaria hypoxylon TaxID=37992 RepID=A0A4Z0Z1M8_9PEZI|nr:hypothetical protein E0Z10_g3148 [Xylaria hypoxylon]
MAPVTRRAAKARGDSPQEEPTNTVLVTQKEISFEEPIAVRSKRKTSSDVDKQKGGASITKIATPKRKKLEVRIRKDNGASTKSPIEIQIPSSSAKTPRSRSSPVPDSQETDVGDQTFEPLSASKQLEEEATQRLRESGLESTPLSKAAKSTRVGSAQKAREESTPKAQPQSQSIEPKSETEATPRPKAAKSSHVVFGDDDDIDKFVAAATEKEKDLPEANGGDEDEEEQEDSDDDAPEAVSTAAAAKETLKSARAAIEAAEKFAATTKRKRQERNNLLKQQAEKRKRTKPTTSGNEDSSEDEEEEEEEEEEKNTTSKRQRRTQKLPDTLPAEFLTDSSEDEDDETALKKMVKPKKITFETAMQVLGAEGKGPRDEVVGSTRYRVLAQQSDDRLAPKVNKDSRASKEALLRRKRVPAASNKKRGFFVKR